MPTEFKLPELGENIEAGDVVNVLVSVGDTIERDQTVLELETDKATVEVPSSVAGTVKTLKVKPGDTVKVGQTILTVEEDGGAAAGTAKPQAAAGERDEEAQAEGKKQTKGKKEEAAAEDAADAGAPEGDEAAGAAEPAEEEREDRPAARAKAGRGEVVDISRGARPAGDSSHAEPRSEGAPTPAAPSVRRFARELGVDLARVRGSGPGGRISIDDVKSYTKRVLRQDPGRATGTPRAEPLPDFEKWGAVERQPMRGIRRKTAQHLSHAWSVVAHVTQCDRADVTALETLRQKHAPRAEAAGGKLTVTAIALKVVASALKVFPQFSASLDLEAEEIVYKQYVHIGIAVDTDRGLLVPVIRDVDRKNVIELSVELSRAAERARSRKLALEEMEGGCFTITNLGGLGGTYFTPIVNWPEVAILGLSRATWAPVLVEGDFQPRLMLPLSLSYDHRVIDGADAIRFLRWVADALEQPFLLTLEG